jgi:hypothetical protein
MPFVELAAVSAEHLGVVSALFHPRVSTIR